jgi:hypothetical protein
VKSPSKDKKEKHEPHKKGSAAHAYERFLTENKKPWLWFNLLTTLGSIGLAVGTFFVVTNSVYSCSVSDLKLTLWLVFTMHLINALETVLNLTGLERKLCTGPMMCVFFIFEVTVLVYMQVVYFES